MDALEFAVNQFTTKPQGFAEDLDLYERLGAMRVEVVEKKLPEVADEAAARLRAFSERGFTCTSVQPAVHALYPDQMNPEPQTPAERVPRFHETIDRFGAAFPGQQLPLVTIGGAAPDHNLREAQRTAVSVYRELADHAAERGLRLAFEPLHPVYMNSDTFVCTLDGAAAMIEAVDRPNFGLAFDAWHLWQEPDLHGRLKRLAGRVFIVHFADWPRGGPRRMNDRVVPGEGAMDLARVFEAVVAAGYRGPCCLEILSDPGLPDSLWQADFADVIERSRRGFQAAAEHREGG